MKIIISIAAFTCSFYLCMGKVMSQTNISCKGCNVYGKIKLVDHGEDYKVKYVDAGEDLQIKFVVDYEYFAGRWMIVPSGEDFKIKVVESGEDFKIKFVGDEVGCGQSTQDE